MLFFPKVEIQSDSRKPGCHQGRFQRASDPKAGRARTTSARMFQSLEKEPFTA